jgi:hypothetical protein
LNLPRPPRLPEVPVLQVRVELLRLLALLPPLRRVLESTRLAVFLDWLVLLPVLSLFK